MAIADVLQPFTWGEGGERLTPEALAKRRQIEDALLAKGVDTSPVGHWSQGLARVADAAAGSVRRGRLGRAEAANAEASQARIAEMLSGMGGGGSGFPGASAPTAGYASGRVAQAHGDFDTKAASIIPRLAADLNLSPEQAAGIVGQLGHESEGLQAINERNPLVPGSRGGFGWAQWTGPRRRQFEQFAQSQGLDPSSDEANYAFLLNELQNTPEGAVLADLRQAPDAQTAGRVFTDKFLRPGIPGYGSRSKWTDRALMAYQGAAGRPPAIAANEALAAGGPTQVASLDPSIGLPAAPAPAQAPQQTAGIFLGTPEEMAAQQQGAPAAPSPLMSPQSVTGGAPMPLQSAGASTVDPTQRVAQAMNPADPSTIPAMAGGTMDVVPPGQAQGYFPPAPGATGAPQGGAGGINPAIMEALSSPYASAQEKQIAGILLQQQMQQNDPMRALEMERAQLELDAMRNPQGDPFTLSAGQTRFDAQGNPIARGQADPGFRLLTPQEAQQQGLPEGAYQVGPDGKISQIGKAGVEINMPGQPNIGTIPQGWQAIQDPDTKAWTMAPIPGGPAAAEAAGAEEKAEFRLEDAMTASDVATTAASRAREAAGKQDFGAAGTTTVANIPIIGPMTDSGEVVRQVDVLKSMAAAENLQAMRDNSPTGGALGNVTEKELKLLSDKSGALDPNSPTFKRDLDDYERTLLRTIHGREAGDRVYEATRKLPPTSDAPPSSNGGATDDEGWRVLPGGVRVRRVK